MTTSASGPAAGPAAGPGAGPAASPAAGSLWRWHYRRSLASRVTLLTTMAVGVAVAFVALSAFMTVRMQLQSSLDASLLNRAHKAAENPGALKGAIEQDVPLAMFGAADIRIGVISTNRAPATAGFFPTMTLDDREMSVASGELDHVIRTVVAQNGGRYRVATVQLGNGEALVLAQSLDAQDRTLARLAIVMTVFGGLGVLVAGLAGWAVARNGLRPVRRLTSAVEQIAETEDLTPLHVEGDDEIARLATAFNQMLTALAASRDRQRRLVADAGHELRTPLTSLRTNVDLLTQAGDAGLPPEAHAELLDDVRAQIEELTTLIGDLTELARDDGPSLVVEPTDLEEVVHHALARVRRRAPGVRFELRTAPWWVEGEAASLERAVTNLLDNAAKWSPAGGTVTVALAEGTLTVDDEGPGIPPQDRPHVFERFYRSEESRSMPGSGLGLAIVRQVAERHSGSVDVADAPGGGARVVLTLPGRAVESAPALPEQAATAPSRTPVGAGRPSIAIRRTPRSGPTEP